MEYTLIGMLWSFCIFSFLGWVVEEIYASFAYRKFVNRGFLNGPVCPLYGVGATMIILFLTPFKHNLIVFYIVSVILTSILEFITGIILLKLFNHRWWDYTEDKMNFMGIVCIPFSLLWGLACVALMYILHPISVKLFNLLSYYQVRILLVIALLIYAFDILVTVLKMLKVSYKIKILRFFEKYIHIISDDIALFIFQRILFMIKVYERAEKELAKAGETSKKGFVKTKVKFVEARTRMIKLIKSRFTK